MSSIQHKRNTFHRKKSLWRRNVRELIEIVDDMSGRHMSGKRISMGELYYTARKIAKAGDKGEQIRAVMDDYEVFKRDRIHESIAATCKLLESASKVLELITTKQGTPVVDFPLYVSDLAATSEIELGAQDAFEALRKGIEG